MKALVLLLACLPYLGGLPAEAQEEETAQQGIKVYTTNDGVIFISNLDGGEERKLTDGYGAALSPDQRQVAFGRDADLYLLNLETMEEKVIVDHKEYDLNHIVQPIWHPNGRLIFFHEPARLFEEIIYSVEIDGSNLKLLAQYGYFPYYSWPSPFSPDGRKFLFNDCFDACSSLLIYDIDDDIKTRLSRGTDYGSWSPDGRYVAFGELWRRGWDTPGLFIWDVNEQELLQILGDVIVGAISWSPDGTRIAFNQIPEDDSEDPAYTSYDVEDPPLYYGDVYEVALDGTGLKKREGHFDKWEHTFLTTVVSQTQGLRRTWGQIKREQQ